MCVCVLSECLNLKKLSFNYLLPKCEDRSLDLQSKLAGEVNTLVSSRLDWDPASLTD